MEKRLINLTSILRTSTACTGSIIGDAWVLTSSHCVTEDHPENISIGIGHLAHSKSTATKIISVKKVYLYNNVYDPHLTRDVALLQLNEPTGITLVSLPDSPEQFSNLKSGNQAGTIIGGYTDIKWSAACDEYPNDPKKCHLEWNDLLKDSRDNYLHYGHVIIQSDQTILASIATFNQRFPRLPDEGNDVNNIEYKYNVNTMLDSSSDQGTVTTVHDSGAPLIISTNSVDGKVNYMQIGVTSWGVPNPFDYYAAYKFLSSGIEFLQILQNHLRLILLKKQ